MKVLFIEPFYGGSHRLFADRFVAFSEHQVELITLPASFWKWRMRGAHLPLAEKVRAASKGTACLLTTDMLSLAELVAVVPELSRCPKIVYFHENQLSYPVPKGEAPDVHFGFTNLSTALAADRLVFNSKFHMEEFLLGIPRFLKAMPDRRPGKVDQALRPKGAVVYPGIDCRELQASREEGRKGRPLTIVWNHRWEFDKQPEVFFRTLGALAEEGLDFRVHVLGENFQVHPRPFLEAREVLGRRLASFGFLEERKEYVRLLWQSDVVVSTSLQEFYGIAVMEAAYCGCRPLVPRRLVYPELYEEEFLYTDEDELKSSLRLFIEKGTSPDEWEESLRRKIAAAHDVRGGTVLLDDIISRTSG
jgi:glycosyltransferase involved in cell wall biosynthesis